MEYFISYDLICQKYDTQNFFTENLNINFNEMIVKKNFYFELYFCDK